MIYNIIAFAAIIISLYLMYWLIKKTLKWIWSTIKGSTSLNAEPNRTDTDMSKEDAMVISVLQQCEFSNESLSISDDFKCAGITFGQYADETDGCLIGYAKPEPNNPHDPHAIALYSWCDLKLGYIARNEQLDYAIFSGSLSRLPFCCVISSFINDEGELLPTADITFVKGTQPEVTRALINHLQSCEDQAIPLL